MKRTAAVFLAVSLFLLAACRSGPSGPAAPGDTPAFSLSSLPEIGDFVPDTAPPKNFFPEGPADEFTPRDDYGTLVPYIAEAAYLRSPRYTSWTDPETGETETWPLQDREEQYNAVWGLAAADGRAVTKGIFSSVQAYEYEDGRGFYLLYALREEEETYAGDAVYTPAILTDEAGSWAVSLRGCAYALPFFRFGLPLILTVDGETNAAVVYGLNGEAKADLSRFVVNRYGYPDFPGVLFADETCILLRGYTEESGSSYTVTAVDWNGRTLSAFTSDDPQTWYCGGRALIVKNQEQGYGLVRFSGARLTEDYYVYIGYSDALGGFVGRRRAGAGKTEIQYFDETGAETEVKNAWTDSSVYLVHEDHAVTDENGKLLLFLDSAYERAAYDLWGGRLPLPAEGEAVGSLAWIENRAENGGTEKAPDEETPPGFIYIRTADGRDLLCAANGGLLAEIEAPFYRKTEYQRYPEISVTAQNGRVYVVAAAGDLIVYGPAGEEIARIPGFYPSADENTAVYMRTVNCFGENVIAALRWDDEETGAGGNLHAYCLSDPVRPLGRLSFVVSFPFGGVAAISKTQSLLLGPDGETLMRFTLPVFY